jgi:anaerobic selenocysteine-containing dehydrogenase
MTGQVIAARVRGAYGLVGMDTGEPRTAYRTCPLCEATCGLEIKLDGERITSIRGDADDVFSHGFICPKARPCAGCTRIPIASARR